MSSERSRNCHGLPTIPKVASPDPAISNEKPGESNYSVAGDRETQALSRNNHSAVDTDYLSPRAYQGTARIAGIQGSVGLDDVVDRPPWLRAERSSESTENP